jgi:hypothetical protein
MRTRASILPIVLMMTMAVTTEPSVAAKQPLSIRVSPATAFAPANLVVRASIEPDTANRAVEIVADSDEFYRSSLVPLDGERAPRTSTLEFRGCPPGQYEVFAGLIGADGRARAIARAHVTVVESGASR